MPTSIYQSGLKFFIEADELSGANGSAASVVFDLSGYDNHLQAASNQPTVKTNAVNGKKSINFSGTNNPLKSDPVNFNIRCGFMVVKAAANFTNFAGILTGLANAPVLVGGNGTGNFFDLLYDNFEYRLNDRIYSRKMNASGTFDARVLPAPVGGFGIVFFKFWQNTTLDGIQLGQDRADTSRKFTGEIALLALYDRDFCETEVRTMMRSLSSSYQIPLPDVFPFQGMKQDARQKGKVVLTDDQFEPNVRVKRGARTLFNLSFASRRQKELLHARAFWDEFYPHKRFIYRDYATIPPEDTICRFPVPSEFNDAGATGSYDYDFDAIESAIAPAAAIAPETIIPDDAGPIVILNEFGGGPYSGDHVEFYASSSDLSGVTLIALYIDGAFYAQSAASDSQFEVDTTAYSNGFHTIQARAVDTLGNIGYSPVLTVQFLNDQTSPTAISDLTFTATGTATGTAAFTLPTDNVEITAYDLEINGSVEEILPGDLTLVTGNIYSYALTGLAPNTLYTLRLRAKDQSGNTAAWSNNASDTTDAVIPLLLDEIVSDVQIAAGLRKLSNSYSGSCIRVKRASDNTETNIGFSGTLIDTAAVTSFGSGTTLSLVRIYDQSGNARHFNFTGTLPTVAVVSGKVQITFAAGAFGRTDSNVAVAAPKIFTVLNPSSIPSIHYLFDCDNAAYAAWLTGGGVTMYNGASASKSSVSTGLQQLSFFFQSGNDEAYKNGAALSGTGDAGDTSRNGRITLGSYGGSADYTFLGTFHEFILIDGSTSDRNLIEGNQIEFYDI